MRQSEQENHKHAGEPYLGLLRCSNLSQADDSPETQKAAIDTFALDLGLVWVGDYHAEGVSGSQTFNRADIEAIIKRKTEKNDFSIVIVYDLSRLTRGGIRHGNVLEDRFKKAGITLLSATDQLPDGPEGDLIKTVKHYSNQLHARIISLTGARGMAHSLKEGTRPAAARTPYGLDRLYRGPDGTPRMLIRWDANVQHWLRPNKDGEPIEEVGQAVKPLRHGPHRKAGFGKQFKGYARQPDETSELVPGAKDRREVLTWIFNAYDAWRWGYRRIARDLNRRGVPAPEGGSWREQTVRKIVFNPIYLGVEVRHRYSGALYHEITAKGPVPVSVDQDALERDGRKCVPLRERLRDDWVLVDKPALKDLLPENVRGLAMQRITAWFDQKRTAHPKAGVPIHKGEAVRQKHLDSPYLLSKMIRHARTGQTLGTNTARSKRKGGYKEYRYYLDPSARIPTERTGAVRFPAAPLEEAVVNAVWDALRESNYLEQRLREQVKVLGEADQGDDPRQALIDERAVLAQRLKQAYQLLGKLATDELAAELEADRHRIEVIDEKLKALDATHHQVLDADKLVAAALDPLNALPEAWRAFSNAQVKQLLAVTVEDLTFDPESRELTFTLVLPCQTTQGDDSEHDDAAVRLEPTLPWQWRREANASLSLKIDDYRCKRTIKRRRDCYACQRKPAA